MNMYLLRLAVLGTCVLLCVDGTPYNRLTLLDELESILDELETRDNELNNETEAERAYGYDCGKSTMYSRQVIEERIVGGDAVTPHQYPWLAMVYYKGSLKCGGSVIGKRWVLSAAHCFYQESRRRFKVYLGVHNQYTSTAQEQTLNVKEWSIHPNYNPVTFKNDIAILEVDEDIIYDDYVQPVCLTSMAVTDGSSCIITGWGQTSTGGTLSDLPRSGQVAVLSHSSCVQKYAPILQITNKMFCAASSGVDTCQGDSGGPVVELNDGVYKQYGITSFGLLCDDPTFPGVYTRISPYTSWIKSKTMNEVTIYDES